MLYNNKEMPNDSKINESTITSFLNHNAEIYNSIYKCTYQLIKKYSLWDEKTGMVDVRRLAEKKSIRIQDQLIKPDNAIINNEILGYYKGFSHDEDVKEIYVNSNLSELFKRYVIAHELAHYFMNDKGNSKLGYCINMLFPVNGMERLCDLFASFLLMPFNKVLELWERFKKENDSKGDYLPDTYDWLKYLACNFGVTEYHVALMYYDIRALGGVLYTQYRDKPIENEDWIPDLSAYEKFFKGMKSSTSSS